MPFRVFQTPVICRHYNTGGLKAPGYSYPRLPDGSRPLDFYQKDLFGGFRRLGYYQKDLFGGFRRLDFHQKDLFGGLRPLDFHQKDLFDGS